MWRTREIPPQDCEEGRRWLGINDGLQQLFRNKWLAAVTAVGILLLVFGAAGVGQRHPPQGSGSGSTGSAGGPPQGSSGSAGSLQTPPALQTAEQYDAYYDQQLQRMIDQISGISDALVMVTVNTTPTLRLGQNVTTSRQTSVQSGSSGKTTTATTSTNSQVVTLQGASGGQTPVVVQQQLPTIAGVLVVARAADAIRMEAAITTAVEDALGIPGYEITVMPRK